MPIFENSNVLVVDKRAGYLSVLSRLGERELRPCEYLEWGKKRGVELWSVHRLDEEVSGLLVLAKTPKAHSILSQAFENRTVQKTYEAWTEIGADKATQDLAKPGIKQTWECVLLRGKKRAYEKPFGKRAVTDAAFLGEVSSGGRTFWQWHLFPLTGRSHQLRYECHRHQIPIVGDSLYGSSTAFGIPNAIALRAVSLDFTGAKEREVLELPTTLEAKSLTDWVKASCSSGDVC